MATESPPNVPDRGTSREPSAHEYAAFSELFTTYFAPVYRYVYGRVPNVEQAKDIVQLVFARLWVWRPTLEPGRSVLPLLCTIARRVIVDYLRHERIEQRFARQRLRLVELEGPPAAAEDPERQLLQRELSAVVQGALDGLSPRQREVMMLRWREHLSYDEIARQLGISKKTVAIHLTRAMEHLRQTLPDMYDVD